MSNDQVKRVDVERLNCTNGGSQYCYGCYQMTIDNEYGDYVSYDDYDALLRRLAERDADREVFEHNYLREEEKAASFRRRAEAAEARVRELERDAARLDWFSSGGIDRIMYECPNGDWCAQDDVIGAWHGDTPRAAIDAAMASEVGG
ncbi:MAG TPA: hypothetical protein VJ809_04595 [Pirellulales bacterium]|nr:hypothetical protein [Pirellulales bacterium]